MKENHLLLAGDVGATKSDLAVFSPQSGPRTPITQAQFRTTDYPDLTTMARAFLAQAKLHVDRASFDVAGPVIAGRAQLTNVHWTPDEATLLRDLRVENVHLLNDLQATGYAIPLLRPEDLHTLNAGTPVADGAIAVIAPGTGLGEAFLTRDGSHFQAYPSEGGHTDFAPVNAEQIGLLLYMQARYDHVSYEHVCSGIGIPPIYDYLRTRGAMPEAPDLAAAMVTATDRTPIIVDAALRAPAPDPLSAATLELFVAILGAESGNLALKVLATGGLYLAGGIPLRILPLLDQGRFLAAFRNKGRFAELLGQIPVHVIMQQVALMGAAQYGLSLMEK